jgi:hypothetical protein
MIPQVCQRCGYVFPANDEPSSTDDMRCEESVTLWIGNWQREYRICTICAAKLIGELRALMEARVK